MPTKSVSHKSRPYRHFMGTNHSHRCPLFAPVWRDSRWDGITPPYLQKQPPSEQVPTFFFSVGYAFNRKDYRYHFLSSERASIANGLSVALPRLPMQLAGQKPRPTLRTEVHRIWIQKSED